MMFGHYARHSKNPTSLPWYTELDQALARGDDRKGGDADHRAGDRRADLLGALAEDIGDGGDDISFANLVIELDPTMHQPAALRPEDMHRADDVVAPEALDLA